MKNRKKKASDSEKSLNEPSPLDDDDDDFYKDACSSKENDGPQLTRSGEERLRRSEKRIKTIVYA